MNMKMKKISALCVVGAMSMGLIGCSSESGQGSSASSSDNDKQVITAWAWDSAFNIPALEEAAAIYEAENPDVQVEIVEFAQDDIIQKLNAGLSSGSTTGLPNVVLIEDYRSQTFLRSYPGAFADLSSVVNPEDFAEYKLDFMTIDGSIYGVPFDSGVGVLYYRRDLIEAAGYTDEDMQNITWSEYIQIGKDVKEATGVQSMTVDPNDEGFLRLAMQSAGVWYVEADGETPNFENNEALREALLVYKEIVDEGLGKTTSEWAHFVGAVNGGEVALVPTGAWFTSSIMAAEDQAGLWGVAPYPRLDDAPNSVNSSNIGGSSWYVIEGVENSDIAIDFLGRTFAGDAELYETLLEEIGAVGTYLPGQTGDAYMQEVEFFGGQAVYNDMANWSSEIPPVNYGLHTYAFGDIIKTQMQALLNGTDVDTCLANAQQQAESQIR